MKGVFKFLNRVNFDFNQGRFLSLKGCARSPERGLGIWIYVIFDFNWNQNNFKSLAVSPFMLKLAYL